MHIFFLLLLHFLFINAMENPNRSTQLITCDADTVWRPSTNNLIFRRWVPHALPEELATVGPKHIFTPKFHHQTVIYNPQTRTERILAASNELPIFAACSPKGTYYGEIFALHSQVIKDKIIPNSTNQLNILNLETLALTATSKTFQLSFVFSPQENYFACDSPDYRHVEVKNTLSGALYCALLKKFENGKGPAALASIRGSISFSPQDEYIAFEEEEIVKIADLRNPSGSPKEIPGHTPYFTKDKLIVRHGASLVFFDLPSFTQKLRLTDPVFFKNWRAVQFDEDYSKAIAPFEGSNQLRQLQDNRTAILQTISRFIAVSQNLLKYAYYEGHDEVVVADLSQNSIVELKLPSKGNYRRCYFSPDGQYLLLEALDLLTIWHLQKGTTVCRNVYPSRAPFYAPFCASSCCPNSRYLILRVNSAQTRIIDLEALNYKPL
ncbi:hypothetical protein BH09DEP1_BH09DEP1_6750 [soil metagenome]